MKINKVLIVDDEKPIYSYLQKKLGKLGYTVYAAQDGEQALHLAHKHRPDVILLDVKLPILGGLEVCRCLKSDDATRHIPIIILSAKAQSEEIAEGLQAGADRYLCKPIGFPDILREIQAFAE